MTMKGYSQSSNSRMSWGCSLHPFSYQHIAVWAFSQQLQNLMFSASRHSDVKLIKYLVWLGKVRRLFLQN